MFGAKAISTPMATNANLKLNDGLEKSDEIEFRKAIGSLQYLSLTRPNITYFVNKLAQFMYAPSTIH